MNHLLKKYEPLVDFLADYLGTHAEVVLHDLTDLEHSIVKIRNGHISGRREGDPCTDLVLRVIQQASDGANYKASYYSTDRNGRPIKSGSYYIKNPEGKLVGMICVNIETDSYTQLKAYLDSFFALSESDDPSRDPVQASEKLGTSIDEMVDAILRRTIADFGEVALLSHDAKGQLIEKLNDEGIFLLKGAVDKTAAALDISKPTVYRYIGRLKKE